MRMGGLYGRGKLKTQNSKHKTQNTKLKTQNSKHKTTGRARRCARRGFSGLKVSGDEHAQAPPGPSLNMAHGEGLFGGEAAAEVEAVVTEFAEGAGGVEEDADLVEVTAGVIGEAGDARELSGGECLDDPGVDDEAFMGGEGLVEVRVGERAGERTACDGTEVGEGKFRDGGGETHKIP